MKFCLAIRAAAREDIRGARDRYEDQALGLGDKFGEALDGAMTLISENPMMFPAIRWRTCCGRKRTRKKPALSLADFDDEP